MPIAPNLPPQPVPVSAALQPIFAQFLEIQRGHLARLETALAAGDIPVIHRLAHTIKGAAATYQLPEAAALARELEAMTEKADLRRVPDQISALRQYFNTVTVRFVA